MHSSPGITITEACLPLKPGTMFRNLHLPHLAQCLLLDQCPQTQANVESLEFFGHLKHQKKVEKVAGVVEGSRDSRWKEEMSSQKAGHANVQKAPDIEK